MKNYPYITGGTDEDGRYLNVVVHSSINPMAPIALMDMEAKDKLKYGKMSAFYADIDKYNFDGHSKAKF